jgi:putative intracellular protease/amidase
VNVLVLTVNKYNGHELWSGLGILQSRGHTFKIASTTLLIEDETTGGYNRAHMVWNDLKKQDLEEYDGLMIVSGDPKQTEKMWKDHQIEFLVGNFAEQPVAAICAAVPAIRYITAGKRVAFYPLVRARQLLGDAGAILTALSVCVDANLVTAESQARSREWANYFCDLLEGIDPEFNLIDSGHVPKGKPRRPLPEVERLKKNTI